MRNLYYPFFLAILFVFNINSQKLQDKYANDWYVGLNFGIQMSGIKKEDFVRKNYSPLLRAYLGKRFNNIIDLQIGYQGLHFNTIADDYRHFYNFYYTQAVLKLFKAMLEKRNKRNLTFNLGIGFGLFENRFYRNSSIHGLLTGEMDFKFTKNLKLNLASNAIIGWDIYQGDQDIIPGLSIGVKYGI